MSNRGSYRENIHVFQYYFIIINSIFMYRRNQQKHSCSLLFFPQYSWMQLQCSQVNINRLFLFNANFLPCTIAIINIMNC